MKKITNLTSRAISLSDEKGTILAAAGTDGATKVVEAVTEDDARRLAGLIHVSEADDAPPTPPRRTEGKETSK